MEFLHLPLTQTGHFESDKPIYCNTDSYNLISIAGMWIDANLNGAGTNFGTLNMYK